MISLYDAAVFILTRIVGLFFRETTSRGSWQIPTEGPVMFVVAPHANQFVDPIILLRHISRRIGFLVAKKSYDRRWVGGMAKIMNTIPVARAQDYSHSGAGHVFMKTGEERTLFGTGTKFLSQLRKKDSIFVNGNSMEVDQVLSDEEAVFHHAAPHAVLETLCNRDAPHLHGHSYKIWPHVDQSTVYQAVFSRLHEGECIGIFPEGGSHDRAEMLPLKAGCALMALGAMDKYPGLDVKIVPCGLNYFHAHKFRSRAVIEFGEPFSVDADLVEMYKKGGHEKKDAIGKLLTKIHAGLQAVTVNATDFESLQVIQAARRLYKPKNTTFTLSEVVELTRRFAKAYQQLKQHSEVKHFSKLVLAYNQLLRDYGLQDHQVEKTALGPLHALRLLFIRLFKLLILILIALPMAILNLPIIMLTSIISNQKAKEALLASSVKIAGRDVLATWKLMVAIVLTPALYTLYSIIICHLVINVFQMTDMHPLLVFIYAYTALSWLSYGAVRLAETSGAIIKSFPPLFLSILPGYKQYSLRLRKMRTMLQNEVIKLVENLAPDVFEDFHRNRIVDPAELKRQNVLDSMSSAHESTHEEGFDWASVSKHDEDGIFFHSTSPKPNSMGDI